MLRLAVAASIAVAPLAALAAQGSEGYLVVACFNPGVWAQSLGVWGQEGGLFLVHPRNPGLPIRVAGLPSALTGRGLLPPYADGGIGSDSIAALPDGTFLVGQSAAPGSQVSIYHVQISRVGSGWTGTVLRTFPIGQVPSVPLPMAVSDIEVIDGGQRALFSLFNAQPSVLGGAVLGELDLATGVVCPMPLSGWGQFQQAMAVSVDGQTLYLDGPASNRGIYRMTRIGGSWCSAGAPQLVVVLPPSVRFTMSMDLDLQGRLIVGTGGGNAGTPPNLFQIDPVSGFVTVLLPGVQGVRNAVLVEENTGTVFTGVLGGGAGYIDTQGSEVALTARDAQNGWGIYAGFAMVPAMQSFDAQRGGGAPYGWLTAPNPGGLPLVGNAGFSLTLQTPANPNLSLIAYSTGKALSPIPIVGFTLLLDPQSLVLHALSGPPFTVQLPIPPAAYLAGASLYVQTFHIDGSGPVSSPGLSIRIL